MYEFQIYKPFIIILHTLIRIIFGPLLYFFGHLKIYGIENIKYLKGSQYRKIIFAANHTNELDSILIPFSIPPSIIAPPMYFVSLEKRYYKNFGWKYIIYGGFFFKMLGAFPIKKGIKDYQKSLSTHIKILNSNNPLIIYPEGKRSLNGEIQPARGGVGYLMYATKAIVIPVAISPIHNLNIVSFFKRKHYIKVYIGKPIKYTDIEKEIDRNMDEVQIYKQIASQIMKKVKTMLDELRNFK